MKLGHVDCDAEKVTLGIDWNILLLFVLFLGGRASGAFIILVSEFLCCQSLVIGCELETH